MKWLIRIGAALLLVIGLAIAAVWATALRGPRPVGFQVQTVRDPFGTPFATAIWYPTDAAPLPFTFIGTRTMSVARDGAIAGAALPLVVISHGNGASLASHADLAMELAGAGYVVAAAMHPGDNFTDQSAVAKAEFFSDRALQLRAVVDFMTSGWKQRASIDAQRIGAYGFSAGASTVLLALGAQADFPAIQTHCARTPEAVCKELARAQSPLLSGQPDTHLKMLQPDARIRSAVLAAPGLGFTMTAEALSPVKVPVQLWSAQNDLNVPYATNTAIVRANLPVPPEYIPVQGAQHSSFLLPCGLLSHLPFCQEPDTFDRAAFHQSMNDKVRRFFDRTLARR